MNEHFFIYNNEYFPDGQHVIDIANRSFRYGDGLFETMRLKHARILNLDFHFERFFNSLKILQLEIPGFFSPSFFIEKIDELLKKNKQHTSARVRLMGFRSDGGILKATNNYPHYIIETAALEDKMELNENGLAIDVFGDARKSCDRFSNVKSNNYLPCIMAGLFAQKNNLDDAILLNTYGRVCETAIANVFIIKHDHIYTPPLSEGCVAGTMRRWMLEKFSQKKYSVAEKNISIDEVLDADEIFLTNAIQPMRWVKHFRGKNFGNEKAVELFENISRNI